MRIVVSLIVRKVPSIALSVVSQILRKTDYYISFAK